MDLERLKRYAEYYNKQDGRKYPCSNQIVRCAIVTDDKDKAINFMKDKSIAEEKRSAYGIEWTLDNNEIWIWRNWNESCKGFRFYKVAIDKDINEEKFRMVDRCCGLYCCSVEII